VNVAENITLVKRTAQIRIGSMTHTLTQDPVILAGQVTSISPASVTIRAASTVYNIRVVGVNNWTLTIPNASDWISAKVINDNGFVYSAAPDITGSGSATVQITIKANTIKRRTGIVDIGGKIHTVTQAYR
jgi:hypothetical protein